MSFKLFGDEFREDLLNTMSEWFTGNSVGPRFFLFSFVYLFAFFFISIGTITD